MDAFRSVGHFLFFFCPPVLPVLVGLQTQADVLALLMDSGRSSTRGDRMEPRWARCCPTTWTPAVDRAFGQRNRSNEINDAPRQWTTRNR
jgi:hypothetical protein